MLIKNAGPTGWRPGVNVKLYKDMACMTKIDNSLVVVTSCSGANVGTCSDAVSSNWRPQCGPCATGEAAVQIVTVELVKCITATNLGVGAGGGRTWSGGITVKASLAGNNVVEFQSKGNELRMEQGTDFVAKHLFSIISNTYLRLLVLSATFCIHVFYSTPHGAAHCGACMAFASRDS